LGEHVPQPTNAPTTASGPSSIETSETASSSNAENSSWEPFPPHTHDHWQNTDPDSGRFFDPRDGGPRWPRPGDPSIPDPRPAHSDPDFQFDPPDDDPSPGASSNF
jgi:hypothetical protein